MSTATIDAIAVRAIEIWLLLSGFKLAGDWDEHDPACLRDYGPHRVYTVCGRTLEDIDVEQLSRSLSRYLAAINNLLPIEKLHLYNIECYDRPLGRGLSIYVSICT